MAIVGFSGSIAGSEVTLPNKSQTAERASRTQLNGGAVHSLTQGVVVTTSFFHHSGRPLFLQALSYESMDSWSTAIP
jgi:hypothetical protein